jgi:hypothetical protein
MILLLLTVEWDWSVGWTCTPYFLGLTTDLGD